LALLKSLCCSSMCLSVCLLFCKKFKFQICWHLKINSSVHNLGFEDLALTRTFTKKNTPLLALLEFISVDDLGVGESTLLFFECSIYSFVLFICRRTKNNWRIWFPLCKTFCFHFLTLGALHWNLTNSNKAIHLGKATRFTSLPLQDSNLSTLFWRILSCNSLLYFWNLSCE
jgi:hypothetical protein